MYLNTLSPAEGSHRVGRRVGRGIGSGWGKTSARGHKGQAARKSPDVSPGFEGGQMPLHRRLPKFGFKSRTLAKVGEIRLDTLEASQLVQINLLSLKQAGLVGHRIERVRIINSGKITRSIEVQGLYATKGAKEAILAAGGKFE